MLLALPLLLQLAGAASTPPPAAGDTIYSSPALRALVADAARVNRVVPPELEAYAARLDSEMAFVLRMPDGNETASQIEQTENALYWRRTGEFEQRIVGYRAQSVGLAPSGLSYMRQAWAVPVLYGNRMSLFFGRDTTQERPRARRRTPRPGRNPAPFTAMHPLADDREQVYTYSGGDTVATVLADGRRIPIVRVDVEPDVKTPRPTLVFRGEIDLDAVRHQIVRMRGHFLTVGQKRSTVTRLLTVGVQAVAYVELVNGEISTGEGRFWLPTYQRIEFQIAAPMLGDARSIFRILSRVRDYTINPIDSGASGGRLVVASTSDSLAVTDTMVARPHRLTFAPRDSIADFRGWDREIGTLAGNVHADDFADVAPDAWRPDGPPRLEVRGERFGDFFRFNRIEGVYTGIGLTLRMRDLAPGGVLHGNVGVAWAEGTVRGGLSAQRLRGRWLHEIRAERTLAHTNDFRMPLESSATFAAILGSRDDFDYLDRWSASLATAREVGAKRGAIVRVEAGAARDAAVVPNVRRGLTIVQPGFRINRGIDEGSYVHSGASITWHPDVTGLFLQPGLGAMLAYDRGDGDLRWQRLDARVVGRHIVGPVSYSARIDGGVLLTTAPPPQQLYEIGSTQGLPAYLYKQFSGDQAVLARGSVMYSLPWRGSPVPVWRRFFLPSPAPAFSVGIQSGWVGISDAAAQASVDRLDPTYGTPQFGTHPPLTGPTGSMRSTIDLTVRFFGGAVGIGIARPVDRKAMWRPVITLGQEM